ncbi:MAG: hypothetical protein ACLQVI_06040 [Polyangiaceae bacterium]
MIGLREQGASVVSYFPQFRVSYRGDKMIAEGEVRPTERSSPYRLRVTYRDGDKPLVYVVSPKLLPPDPARSLPHVYPDNRLCLYQPLSRDAWTKKRFIGQTIIPWAIDWLFHYEIWQLTGEWRGGGADHHGVKSDGPHAAATPEPSGRDNHGASGSRA